MIDVCCGLSVSPALFVPPVNPCTCTLVAMLVLPGACHYPWVFSSRWAAWLSRTLSCAISRSPWQHALWRSTVACTERRASVTIDENQGTARARARTAGRGERRGEGAYVKKFARGTDLRGVIYPRPSARRFARTARGIENRFGGRERADA